MKVLSCFITRYSLCTIVLLFWFKRTIFPSSARRILLFIQMPTAFQPIFYTFSIIYYKSYDEENYYDYDLYNISLPYLQEQSLNIINNF